MNGIHSTFDIIGDGDKHNSAIKSASPLSLILINTRLFSVIADNTLG